MSDEVKSNKGPATHDMILLGEDGRFAKTEIERDGKKMTVNHIIGGVWASDLGDKSAFVKFEDGSTAKIMARSKVTDARAKKDAESASKPAPQAKSPAPAAKGAPGAPTKSRFSGPAKK